MPTTASGLPYPADTETPDVPRDIKKLADELEDRLPAAQHSAAITVTVTSADSGTAAVTFPAGKFTAAPIVVVSTSGTSQWVAMSASATATGFVATARHVDKLVTSGSPSVNYIATQL